MVPQSLGKALRLVSATALPLHSLHSTENYRQPPQGVRPRGSSIEERKRERFTTTDCKLLKTKAEKKKKMFKWKIVESEASRAGSAGGRRRVHWASAQGGLGEVLLGAGGCANKTLAGHHRKSRREGPEKLKKKKKNRKCFFKFFFKSQHLLSQPELQASARHLLRAADSAPPEVCPKWHRISRESNRSDGRFVPRCTPDSAPRKSLPEPPETGRSWRGQRQGSKKKKKVKTTSIICHLRAFCFFCYPTLRRYQTITVCSALAHPPFPHRVLFHKKTFYYGSAKILENANRKSRFLQPETPPAFVNEPDLRSVISSLRLCIFLLFSSQNI